jgi:hypothetical protein
MKVVEILAQTKVKKDQDKLIVASSKDRISVKTNNNDLRFVAGE